MYQYPAVFILAVVGFAISWQINRKKSSKEKLVCVIGKDCDKVVHSRYASTIGIDNQILGMAYYAFVAIFAAALIGGLVWPDTILLLFKLASAGAAIFSLYLVFIQAFILKEWCEWCLASALINFLTGLIIFTG